MAEKPCYRILSEHGFYGPNDHLYEYGDEIYYDGTPNKDMEPLNEAAKERLVKYLNEQAAHDARAAAVAHENGLSVPAMTESLEDKIALASAVSREVGDGGRAIMGVQKQDTGIEAVEKAVPDTGMKPRGRPRKNI